MGNLPDYIGMWGASGFWDLDNLMPSQAPRNNTFHIFIDSRNSKPEGLLITGTGKDTYGESKIIGLITPEGIEFTKKYNKDSSKPGAAKGTIIYRGVRKEVDFDFRTFRKKDAIKPKTVSIYAGMITRTVPKPLKVRTFIMKSLEQEVLK